MQRRSDFGARERIEHAPAGPYGLANVAVGFFERVANLAGRNCDAAVGQDHVAQLTMVCGDVDRPIEGSGIGDDRRPTACACVVPCRQKSLGPKLFGFDAKLHGTRDIAE